MIRSVERCRHCGSLDLGGLVVDRQRAEVRWARCAARLQRQEGLLLGRLIEAGGRLVSNEQLAFAIWGDRTDGGPETATAVIKIYLTRLRKVLRGIGAPYRIEVVWGQGYRIDAAAAQEVAGGQGDDAAVPLAPTPAEAARIETSADCGASQTPREVEGWLA